MTDIEDAKPLDSPASLENKLITCLQPRPHSVSWSHQPIPGDWPSVFYPLHHSPNYLKHNAQNQQCFQNSQVFRTKYPIASTCRQRHKWQWFAGKKHFTDGIKLNLGFDVWLLKQIFITIFLVCINHLPFFTIFCIFIVLNAYIKENQFELMDINPELLEYVTAYTCWMFSVMF